MEKLVLFLGISRLESLNGSLAGCLGSSGYWKEPFRLAANMQYHKARHAGVNLFLTLTTVIINFPFCITDHSCVTMAAVIIIGLIYLFRF